MTGLTTSRRGELRLSDADETLRRRSVERQHDPLSFSYSFTFPAETKTPSPAAAADATVTGPILTVNSVSNPAGDSARMEQRLASHSSQNRPFRRRSSQPVSWLGTEKNQTQQSRLTTQNQSDLN